MICVIHNETNNKWRKPKKPHLQLPYSVYATLMILQVQRMVIYSEINEFFFQTFLPKTALSGC